MKRFNFKVRIDTILILKISDISILKKLVKSSFFSIGQIDHHSLTNFGGKFVYQGTSSILAKANVDFKVLLDLERETIVKLEVTSTHPALPRVKVLMSMDGNTNGYNGNFVAVLPKVDQIEASFRVDSKQWLINGLNITASTLKHRVSADLTWDWTQGIKCISD